MGLQKAVSVRGGWEVLSRGSGSGCERWGSRGVVLLFLDSPHSGLQTEPLLSRLWLWSLIIPNSASDLTDFTPVPESER